MFILQSDEAAVAEVAGEAKSEGPLGLGEVHRLGEAVSAGAAPNVGEPTSTDGAWRVLLTAEARVTEEPGAGKPHAGICTGGVSTTFLP